jgi:hypothetical protein
MIRAADKNIVGQKGGFIQKDEAGEQRILASSILCDNDFNGP